LKEENLKSWKDKNDSHESSHAGAAYLYHSANLHSSSTKETAAGYGPVADGEPQEQPKADTNLALLADSHSAD